MKPYDPLQAPDPEEWLALDEAERILLAEEYHRRARIRLPKGELHAILHASVENQVAMAHEEAPAQRAIERLITQGLDRHDAIHAIGSVLIEHMFDLVHEAESGVTSNQPYAAALERLTAETWRETLADGPSGQVTEKGLTRTAPGRRRRPSWR